jgi:hypothetical protein
MPRQRPTTGKYGIILGGSKVSARPSGMMVINCTAEMKWRIDYRYLEGLNPPEYSFFLRSRWPKEIRKFQAPTFLNPKSQNTNIKQITMTKIQNPKQCFGHLKIEI